MVSSTAIPRAIEKVIAVEGLSLIPVKPMIPPATIMGIIFGKIEMAAKRTDLNRSIIDINIISRTGFKHKDKGYTTAKKNEQVRDDITGAYV